MGGGGGDGGAQQREEQRQYEQEEAIRRVNALFGIDDGPRTGPPGQQPNINDFYVTTTADDGTSSSAVDMDAYGQAMEQWQGPAQDPAAITAAAASRNALYDDTKKSVFDTLMQQLNEQGEEANHQVVNSLARRGLTGGGADVAARSKLSRERDNAVLQIGNRADAAASNLKSSDETARLQLIDRIRGGMSADQAITSANIAQANAAESAQNEALANSLGQIFSTYASYNNNQNVREGYEDGLRRPPPFGTWNPNPSSYYGR